MFPRAIAIFLQLCFFFMFNSCQAADVPEDYGALSTGEIQEYDHGECLGLGGYLRNYKQNKKKVVRCEIAHNYYCLQSQVISTEKDLDALHQLGCVELHGDLIINNFHDVSLQGKLQETLSRIKKIKGKLIINQNDLPLDISFDALEYIGDFVFMGQSPLVQLTNNRVNSIKFPKLKEIHCLKNRRRKCVVVGGNRKVENGTRTDIEANGQKLKVPEFFHSEIEVELEKDEDEEEDEGWIGMEQYEEEAKTNKSPRGYTFVNIHAKFFVSRRYVHAVISLLFFSVAAGIIFSTVNRPKRKVLRLLSDKYEYKDNWGRELVPLE